MLSRNLRLPFAPVLAMAFMVAGVARAGDQSSTVDAQVAPFQSAINLSRAELKQLLASTLDANQMDAAFGAIENFASAYSRMSLIDSSAANDGVMESYMQGKLIPALQAAGVNAELSSVIETTRVWTRNEMEIAAIRDAAQSYPSEVSTDEANDDTRRGQ